MKKNVWSLLLLLSFGVYSQAQEAEVTHVWEFDEEVVGNSVEGWEVINYDNPHTTDGILNLTATSGYPDLEYTIPAGTIDPEVSKQIVIRLKNGTKSRRSRFYWVKDGQQIKHDFLVTTEDEDFAEYVIDLTHDTRWSGEIESIRFEIPMPVPSNSVGAIVSVDYIKLLEVQTELVPMPAMTPAPFGVNLAGGDFAPGTQNYYYPHAEELDYFKSKGLTLIRLPFKWERLQPELNGALAEKDLNEIRNFVWAARKRGVWVLFDMHNYGRRKVNSDNIVIGNEGVTIADAGDAWKRIAEEFKDFDNVYAYGLMNEPYGMGSPDRWFNIAQGMINAIRTVDTETAIMVGGESYSSAARWKSESDNLRFLEDPSDNLIFEAHVYFDNDASGSYNMGYDEEGTSAETGINRLRPFVEWLAEHGKRGFIGEYGVPDDDERWNIVLDRTLNYLRENEINGTYWAAGSRWGNHHMAVHPNNDLSDRPQMKVLERYHYADGESTPPLPPLITSTHDAMINVGNQVSYQVTGTGDPTAFFASGLPEGLSIDESTGIISGTIPVGTHTITISASNASGMGNSEEIQLTGIHLKIPGVVEAEYFNDGGQNEGYYDTSIGNINAGVTFRNESVDVDLAPGEDNYMVNYTADNEWLKYTLDVEEEASYRVKLRYKTTIGDPVVNFTLDEAPVSEDIFLARSTQWIDTVFEISQLSEGFHALKFNIVKGGVNFDYFEFSVNAAPTSAPAGLTADRLDGEQAQLQWSAVPYASSYTVKRAESEGDTYEVVAEGISATNYLDEGLTTTVSYFYKVFGSNLAGDGPDSEIASAPLVLGINDPGSLQGDEIQIYPNPSEGNLYLNVETPQNGKIIITVVNASGAVVRVLEDVKKGDYKKEVSLSGLPPGVYYIKMEVGSVSQTRKVIMH